MARDRPMFGNGEAFPKADLKRHSAANSVGEQGKSLIDFYMAWPNREVDGEYWTYFGVPTLRDL